MDGSRCGTPKLRQVPLQHIRISVILVNKILIIINYTGSNRIFTHVNGGILPDYNRQQNNLLQNK